MYQFHLKQTSWPVTQFHPGIIYDISKIKKTERKNK